MKNSQKKKLQEHKMTFRKIKCKICLGNFENERKFINHINDNIHKEILIKTLNLKEKMKIFYEVMKKKFQY